jgi:hypothetical protein
MTKYLSSHASTYSTLFYPIFAEIVIALHHGVFVRASFPVAQMDAIEFTYLFRFSCASFDGLVAPIAETSTWNSD